MIWPIKTIRQTKIGINELTKLLLIRAEAISNRALDQFRESYIEHPGFRTEPLPFLHKDLERAMGAPNDLDKIVFLLGAGTSISAGIFPTKDIIENCKKALGGDVLFSKVKKMREDRKLDISNEDEEPTFEEVLTAYSKIFNGKKGEKGEKEVLQLMREYFLLRDSDFPQKTMITLFNECLAHLAREHLVDFIVTLNFDELLELSLDEDIGPNTYVKILSISRFQWAVAHGLLDSKSQSYAHPDQRNSEQGCEIAKVWLLKPHGTISHENTLRHLIRHVGQFEPDKEIALKQVFKNAFLVVVGYSLSAADLHRILIAHALTGSIKKLFWIDPREDYHHRVSKLREVMERIRPGSFYHIKLDADGFAKELFRRFYCNNRKQVERLGLLPPFRHFLRAFVFQKESVPCTFKNRFLSELVIYCVRMKGWFSSRTISKCHQIRHMLENATASQLATLNDLPKKLKPFVHTTCRPGRAERLFFLRKKFISVGGKSGKLEKRIQQCIPSCMKLSALKSGNEMAELSSEMGTYLQQLKDVAPYTYNEDIATFSNVLIIPNRSVLEALTRWLMSKKKGLHVVGEVGQTIKKEEDDKKIKMITVGDYLKEWKILDIERFSDKLFLEDIRYCRDYVEEIKRKFNKRYNLIPPHQKRYHFTLWEDEKKRIVQGIVFSRVDRQPGTTFYWIRLNLNDFTEKEQFNALKRYMRSSGHLGESM